MYSTYFKIIVPIHDILHLGGSHVYIFSLFIISADMECRAWWLSRLSLVINLSTYIYQPRYLLSTSVDIINLGRYAYQPRYLLSTSVDTFINLGRYNYQPRTYYQPR